MVKNFFVLALVFGMFFGSTGVIFAQDDQPEAEIIAEPAMAELEETIQDDVEPDEGDEEMLIQPYVTQEVDETIGQNEPVRARNARELKEMIRNQAQAQAGNTVSRAVKTLLAAQDLTGGIGDRISVLAQEFNNSAERSGLAEEKIKNRGRIRFWLLGGDKQAAAEIIELIGQNRERIAQLNDLKENCDCDDEVREIIKDQIDQFSSEQDRLEILAEKQNKAKGVIGWFLGLFNR